MTVEKLKGIDLSKRERTKAVKEILFYGVGLVFLAGIFGIISYKFKGK